MSIYVQRVKDPVAKVDSAVDILSQMWYSLYMLSCILAEILVWFSIGWTIITFPILVFVIVLSWWAERENAKHQAGIKKMMTEDPD